MSDVQFKYLIAAEIQTGSSEINPPRRFDGNTGAEIHQSQLGNPK